MKILLYPLSWLYSLIIELRNFLYDKKIFKTYSFDKPIVSIGNLTMGGTGKTPIIGELLRWSIELGLRPAVVSRGYGGNYRNVRRVPRLGDAKVYGDEPVMLATQYESVPIYVGRSRVEAVSELLIAEDVNIIFADDAFQHRQLDRKLDILVIDATEAISNYRILPLGRGRENKKQLRRADFVILNKVNLISSTQKQDILEFLEGLIEERRTKIIECEYYLNGVYPVDSKINKSELRPSERIILVSAIGNPQSFYDLMKRAFVVEDCIEFRDHYEYSTSDVQRILTLMKKKGIKHLVVTQKDAVKLRVFEQLAPWLWYTDLRPKLSLHVKNLFDKILSLAQRP